jgi:uncharacterized protein (DUF1501 family)
MLDPDISTADALAHLQFDERDPDALSRRNFLRLVGMGVGAGAFAGVTAGPAGSLLNSLTGDALTALFGDPSAWAAGPVGPTDGIVVVLGLYGGNDGLNTVVPFKDGNYYTQHAGLAIPEGETLGIDGESGLHPHLTHLKEFWNRGELAIVEGVGYPIQDLSHFNSLKFWMSGRPGQLSASGWLGRWLDGYLAGEKNLYAAAEVGGTVPLHLVGDAQRGTAVPTDRPFFGVGTTTDDYRLYETVRKLGGGDHGPWHSAVAGGFVDHLDLTAQLSSVIPEVPTGTTTGSIQTKLEVAARLINANLGFRGLTAGWNDFDSHALQPNMHPVRMTELNEAVGRFFQTLDPVWASRVTVITFSEFGRTPWANGGAGTDHGSAAPHFVFGQNVKGGRYGQRPSLAGLGRWDRMAHHVDFRSYYASILDGWLGGGSSDVLGGNYENLGLFKRGPGVLADGSIAPIPVSSSSPATFVPTTPYRVVDTRETGTPVEPGGTLRVPIIGGAVPAGATAVVANVTAVDVTSAHYFTVYPGGTARPGTSNINGAPGRPVPNLVTIGIGADGHINVFNSHGTAHCLLDVFGYFTTGAGDRFTPLPPQRLFDTRIGQTVRVGKLAHHERVEIPVAGLAGVPAGATAVVLNLTATETDAPGFLRLTPSDQPAAQTSNVNFWAGDTVPNLAICRLGPDGKLILDGAGEGKHALADVFGYFGGQGDELQAASPRRLLDTREGLGAPLAQIGPGVAIDVAVRGRAGVPSNATAVVLNVAATNVSGPGFVNVWPSGQAMPGTSNLNVLPGQTLANLVICRLGDNGNLMISNPKATCDVLADVMGWFVP